MKDEARAIEHKKREEARADQVIRAAEVVTISFSRRAGRLQIVVICLLW